MKHNHAQRVAAAAIVTAATVTSACADVAPSLGLDSLTTQPALEIVSGQVASDPTTPGANQSDDACTSQGLPIVGPICARWLAAGGAQGALGRPTGRQVTTTNKLYQNFQGGTIETSPLNGTLVFPNPPEQCRTGHMMCADKTTGTMQWVVDGVVQYRFAARFGRPGYETVNGYHPVYLKVHDEISREFNNSPMPLAMYFNEDGTAVHFSADFFFNLNPQGSHGCINIKDYDGLSWLFSQVRVGDGVYVYRSS